MAALLTVHENLTISGTAAANAQPLQIGQTYVLSATTALYYKHGPTGQAAVTSATGVLLNAGATYEFTVRDAQSQSVSAIQVAAGGVLSIARSN